jgi:hypothetical protein
MMTLRVRKLLWMSSLVMAVFAASPALAHDRSAVLFTPPLVPEGQNLLDCYLVNVGEKAREVTITALNRDGGEVDSLDVTLQPGSERVVTAPASDSPEKAPRYCKFTVEGRAAEFRASILVREPGRGSISALAAE